MADSIPSLRVKLGEAQRRIADLEAQLAAAVAAPAPAVVEVPVVTERVVRDVRRIMVDKERIVYANDPALEAMVRELQERLRCISQ